MYRGFIEGRLTVVVIAADDPDYVIDEAMFCNVAFRGDRAVAVSLCYPREEPDLLDAAAQRFRLDAGALRTAAQAALDLPDRGVMVEVAPRRLVGRPATAR